MIAAIAVLLAARILHGLISRKDRTRPRYPLGELLDLSRTDLDHPCCGVHQERAQ